MIENQDLFRPSLDELLYNCTRSGAIAWGPKAEGKLSFFRSIEDAKAVFESIRSNGQFVDIHAWQFTPAQFRLVIEDLFQIGATTLRELSFRNEQAGEFYMVLSKTAKGPNHSRIELALESLYEQAAISK
jgi:hypothetical protein